MFNVRGLVKSVNLSSKSIFMKNKIFAFWLIIIAFTNCSEKSQKFIDSRDDRIYTLVKIGNQTWMAQNLNVDKFNNGDIIPEAKSREEWEKAGKNAEPAWCYYDNDLSNGIKYGRLYNWYAVIDSRGLAPKGYHIPSEDEWSELAVFLTGEFAGEKMKSKWGWNKFGGGTNESGFCGLPGGMRGESGIFYNLNDSGNWWFSNKGGYIWASYGYSSLGIMDLGNEQDGCSVRCLKDVSNHKNKHY